MTTAEGRRFISIRSYSYVYIVNMPKWPPTMVKKIKNNTESAQNEGFFIRSLLFAKVVNFVYKFLV